MKENYFFKIWDIAGEERFRILYLNNYKNCVLIFDLSNKKSIEKIIIEQINLNINIENISIVLWRNNCDINNNKLSKKLKLKYS